MKRLVLGLVLTLTACTATSPSASPSGAPTQTPAPPSPTATVVVLASPVFYETIGDMAAKSDAMVSVRIVGSHGEMVLPDYSPDDPLINPYAGTAQTPSGAELRGLGTPSTVYDAVVTESFAGNLEAGDQIEILEVGGVVDGVAYEVGGTPELTSDLPDLLFLVGVDKHGRYVTAGMAQGRFKERGPGQYRSMDPALPELALNSASEMARAKSVIES
ncbi:hypothetical protein [Tessaracoccus sp. MC1756]|uniref:hypothetical protein n=1 Tax=Tessaracoccus sp. MC1756 TaxID=2760311 RepID=UPI001602255F|nr:hypothetical protein [Tessaracoccus sp. MC1756]MBB1508223.1 hypothetical protein [Tessaracoccus sp. MC1756]